MAGYEYALGVICGECEKHFVKAFSIYNVTNTDYKSNIVNKLLTDRLNKVTCPFCHATFTYERPHLAYSLNKGYAIYAGCNTAETRYICGSKRLFEIFGINTMRFRLVDFLCEVAEKVRIFESGLDDISIEKLKAVNFGEEYFADKTFNILLFKCIENDNIVFEYCDSLGNVLETHNIPYEQYRSLDEHQQPEPFEDGYVIWTKIDTNYIKEIAND